MISAVSAAAPAPKAIVDALVLRETETRTVSYLTVTEDMAGAAPEPTPELLKDYHAKSSAQFMAPEFRTFVTVTLKSSAFGDQTQVSEVDLRKAYDAAKSKYETPERRTIHQITYDDEAKAKEGLAALKSGAPSRRSQ